MFESLDHSSTSEESGHSVALDLATVLAQDPADWIKLKAGDVLFHAGDSRDGLFRVEKGALCHTMSWPDGRYDVIEFAFPGDIVGIGHLERHVSSAHAMVDTKVSPLSREAFEFQLLSDSRLAARVTAAADREFDFARLQAEADLDARETAVSRLAGLLSALAHVAQRESAGSVRLSGDDIAVAGVTARLGLDDGAIRVALADLKSRGLVSAAGRDLLIKDLARLEAAAID